MTKYTFAEFQKMLNITPTDITAENTERLIEHAIGLLNIFGAHLPEMSGNYGNKYISVNNTQWAAILHVSRMVYIDFVLDASGTFTIQGLDIKSREYTTDPQKAALIQTIAESISTESGEYDDAYDELRLI